MLLATSSQLLRSATLLLLCTIFSAPLVSERSLLRSALEIAYQTEDVPSTLLLLKLIADDATAQGEKAPDYNLCDFTIEHTHLFCAENKGIARINMPQLSGIPIPGSLADKLPRNARGEVNATNSFSNYLENTKKYTITRKRLPVQELKATQNELIGSKVAGIWAAMRDKKSPTYHDIMESGIFVSSDNYVLDGHHRWAAAVAHAISTGTLASATMVVNQISAPIETLVKDANEFARQFGIKAEAGVGATTATPVSG